MKSGIKFGLPETRPPAMNDHASPIFPDQSYRFSTGIALASWAVILACMATLLCAGTTVAEPRGAQRRPVKPSWRPDPPEHAGWTGPCPDCGLRPGETPPPPVGEGWQPPCDYCGTQRGGHPGKPKAAWTECYFVDDAEPPTPSSQERARGFMLYSRPYLSLVFDNSVPHGDDKAEKLTCSASPGEYESMTFAIYAMRQLDAVNVQLDDLQLADTNQRIPASQIQVHLARGQHKRIAERAIYKGPPPRQEFMYMPSWLFIEKNIDMPAGQSAWFWVTVHVPNDAVPGTYITNLTVSVAGKVKARLPVRVDVLPIRLDKLADYPIGYYFRTGNREPSWSLEERMAGMRAYGMTTVVLLLHTSDPFVDDFAKIYLDEQGKLQVDFAGSSIERAMEAYKNLGYPAPPVIPLSGRMANRITLFADPESLRHSEMYLDVLKAFKAECEKRGWPTPILSPHDETPSHGWPALSYAARRLRLMKQAGFHTELNHFLAYPRKTKGWVQACLPFLDVITLIYSTDQTPQEQPPWKECVDLTRQYGKNLYIYNALQTGSVQPTSWRFMTGWFFRTWGKDVQGAFYYVFDQRWSSPKNNLSPFRGSRTRANQHAWYRPNPKRGIAGGPSIDMACAREGIDDLRYILTLERLIVRARSHETNANAQKAATEAEQVLKSIIDSFDFSNAPHITMPQNGTAIAEWTHMGNRDGLPTVSGEYLYRNGWAPADYNLAREKVAGEIIKLQNFLVTIR